MAEFTSLQKELEQRDSQRDDLVLQLKVSYLKLSYTFTCNPSTKCSAGPSERLLFLMEVLYLFRSSQCSTIGVTKAVVCVILSGMMHIKEPLLLIGKSSICSSSRFSHLPYNHK